ncbi:MAG: threonine synthase [Candidatus Micrarchaeia archaeon]
MTVGKYVLKCRVCGHEEEDSTQPVCEECFGPLKAVFDIEKAKETLSKQSIKERPRTLWRYQELLPVKDKSKIVELNAGFTPLFKANQLGKELGLKNLFIKNDSVNPSFSFKDRPVATGIVRARELGKKVLSCASTGNLAASTAAYAAKAGMKCVVFVPNSIEENKISQALAYGAKVLAVDGNYDVANRLANEAADAFDWAALNVNIRPWYAEGEKTLLFETFEQLNWTAPDCVVFPMGSGGLLCEAFKALEESKQTGFLEDNAKTRFFGAQGQGAAPIVTAFKENAEIKPLKTLNTIAKSIAMGAPGDGEPALKIIKETNGNAEDPTNTEIINAISLLAKTEGVFTEPAGGAALAALKRFVEKGAIQEDEKVVLYITGNGLKTPEIVSKAHRLIPVKASITNVQKEISRLQPSVAPATLA